MTMWPNWIDLIIVTVIFGTCYNGFVRGILAELFLLIGAVSVTAITVNYAAWLARWVQQWVALPPPLIAVLGFWILFFGALILGHWVIKRLTEVFKWERVHWFVQSVGLCLGGLRGLWWSGFLLIVLTSSGLPVLQTAVEQRSVLGPRLVSMARRAVSQAAERFPGAQDRGSALVPPIRPNTP
ncbi:MAG: CvpA family protein [Candidatus Omnitrophica bacterium]|nr:CvpA family protein [Candidatus Omnitrophota bacterium]